MPTILYSILLSRSRLLFLIFHPLPAPPQPCAPPTLPLPAAHALPACPPFLLGIHLPVCCCCLYHPTTPSFPLFCRGMAFLPCTACLSLHACRWHFWEGLHTHTPLPLPALFYPHPHPIPTTTHPHHLPHPSHFHCMGQDWDRTWDRTDGQVWGRHFGGGDGLRQTDKDRDRDRGTPGRRRTVTSLSVGAFIMMF